LKKEIKEDLLMDWQNQYWENVYIKKVIYMFNTLSIETPLNTKVHVEPQKTTNSQGNTEQKQ
jgi:hypothetical protein